MPCTMTTKPTRPSLASASLACALLIGCHGSMNVERSGAQESSSGAPNVIEGAPDSGSSSPDEMGAQVRPPEIKPQAKCDQLTAGAPLRRLNTTELEYAVIDVYGGELSDGEAEEMELVAMAPSGDECDTTSECQGIWGPESNDCRDSRSESSLCMCGNVPCYELAAQQPQQPEQPGGERIAPNFIDALPQEGVLGGFSTVGSALDSGVLFSERYVQEVEALARPIVAQLERSCEPQAGRQGECGVEILEGALRRLFRRDLTSEERSEFVSLITAVSQQLDFERGLQAGVMASLTSTKFLFVQPEAIEPNARSLTGGELATRLALALWLSVPDEALLEAAARGELLTDEGLAAQVDRMMADERFERFVDHLVDRWLGLDQLDQADVDLEAHGLSEGEWVALRADMRQESQRLVEHVVAEDRPISELFQADYSFLSPRLSAHYGVPAAPSAPGQFIQVQLPPEGGRAGVLTHGAFLATLGSGERISVIRRGASILSGYLCETFPDPPEALLAQIEAQEEEHELSEREKLEQRAQNPACLGCHHAIDPVGWSFAGFDNLGAPRLSDEHGLPIDERGVYRNEDFSGADGLVSLVGMSEGRRFESCMTSRLLTYTSHRVFDVAAREEDACLVDEILDAVESDNRALGLRSVIRELFLSPAFRQQGPEIIEGAIKKEHD